MRCRLCYVSRTPMHFWRAKIAGYPLGLWLVLSTLAGFIVAGLLLQPVLFPHAIVFLRRGMWGELLAMPAAAPFLGGIIIACAALVGLLQRRLWGMVMAQAALCIIGIVLLAIFPVLGYGPLLLLIPMALANVGLWRNRTWFDERL